MEQIFDFLGLFSQKCFPNKIIIDKYMDSTQSNDILSLTNLFL